MSRNPRRTWPALAAAAVLTLATTVASTATARAATGPAAGSDTAAGSGTSAVLGPCRAGYVALTFDDGPGASTGQLLGTLAAAHARATLFEVGSNADANPDLVRQSLRAGMWIGNHTYTHAHLTQVGEPTAYEEIASTQASLEMIDHHRPVLFRPPYGETSAQVRADEQRLGLLEVLWTVDTRDWAGVSTDDIVAAAATVQPGGIILMHDWPANTLQAIPRIVADLRARGLCPGRIGYTPQDISGVGTIFHAIAVRP